MRADLATQAQVLQFKGGTQLEVFERHRMEERRIFGVPGVDRLQLRGARKSRQERELFARGRYLLMRAIGEKHRHVVAFARSHRRRQILVLAGWLFAQLGADFRQPIGEETWGDTTVLLRRQFADKRFCDIFTGHTVAAEWRRNHLLLPFSEVFSRLPVSVLVPGEGQELAG